MYQKIKDIERFGIIVVRIVKTDLLGKENFTLQMIPYEEK